MLFVKLLPPALYVELPRVYQKDGRVQYILEIVRNKLDSTCESTNFIINLIDIEDHVPILPIKIYTQLIQTTSLSALSM